MASFHEVRFPTPVSLGASGGPSHRTQIVGTISGGERRNGAWLNSLHRYDAGFGVRTLDDLYAVIAFFEARQGRLHGFRWKDGADFRSGPPLQAVNVLDAALGLGDGATTQFQLVKQYQSGTVTRTRTITKPVAGSVVTAIDGAPVAAASFSVDTSTGVLTFDTAPGSGSAVTAGFEFDVPVRFDTDRLDVNLSHFNAGQIPSIPLIELRNA